MEMNKLFIFFLLSILFLQTPSFEADLIQDMCKKFSSVDSNINYEFCMKAFRSNRRSKIADLGGLGTISMQLTMALVKKTGARIKWLIESGRFDAYDRDCLDVCLELYTDAKSTLRDSLKALEEKSYRDASEWVSAVMDVAVTCEDGFRERGDYESPLTKEKNYPLTKENDYLIQLTAIILQIINHDLA